MVGFLHTSDGVAITSDNSGIVQSYAANVNVAYKGGVASCRIDVQTVHLADIKSAKSGSTEATLQKLDASQTLRQCTEQETQRFIGGDSNTGGVDSSAIIVHSGMQIDVVEESVLLQLFSLSTKFSHSKDIGNIRTKDNIFQSHWKRTNMNSPLSKYGADFIKNRIPALIKTRQEAGENLASVVETKNAAFEAQFKKLYPIFSKVDGPVSRLPETHTVPVSDLLLSRTYSTNPEKTTEFYKESIKQLNQNEFSRDAVTFLGLSIAQGHEFPVARDSRSYLDTPMVTFTTTSGPLKFIDALASTQNVNFSEFGVDNAGHYTITHNVIVNNVHKPFILAHEMAHAMLALIFENGAAPYQHTDPKNKVQQDYERAVEAVKDSVFAKFTPHKSFYAPELFVKFFDNPVGVGGFLGFNVDEIALFEKLATPLITDAGDQNKMHAELIARLPDAYIYGIDPKVINEYLGPLEEFWHNHISPVVHGMQTHHDQWCEERLCSVPSSGLVSDQSFQHCVSDLL